MDMAELTTHLEGIANDDVRDIGGPEYDDECDERRRRRNRRLCPPEITFLDAIVSCRYIPRGGGGDSGMKDVRGRTGKIADEDDESFAGRELRLDSRGALTEWAEAHRYMKMPSSIRDRRPRDDDMGGECHRGVSVMRTVDAEIWSNRSIDDEDDGGGYGCGEESGTTTNAMTTSGECEFYYDWTYSSPYAGTAVVLRNPAGDPPPDGGVEMSTTTTTINNRQLWRPLRKSCIPLHMLRDNTKPILLYDDVHMYEDDLHDNGEVSLNVKIRVMPNCWYVLQRLFVRVDRVCVRCREVRYFCSFDDLRDCVVLCDDKDEDAVRANVIYRDVTWREATWGYLEDVGMPTDPAAWRERDGNAAAGGNSAIGIPVPPPLASLLMRLPSVALPDDIPKYSCFDVSQST